MTEHNFPVDSAAVSDRGLSQKRPQNEDSFLEMKETRLFAVADGVGGAQAGDVASQMAVEVLGEAFSNFDPNTDAEEMMKIAIEKANSAIFQMSRELAQLSMMATTVVALHISGNIATIGHVGDSRLYRLDGRGRLFPETLDHSVVAEEVRAGRMTVAQAANHPSRNIISRALGADWRVDVDLKTIMFEPKTTFLLCSDGITRHIEDFEIRDLLISMENPEEICQRMKEICYERGAEDNLTAIIARVNSHLVKNSESSSEPIGSENEKSTVISEMEEVTLASPRATMIDEEIIDASNDLDNEIPTKKLEMPAHLEENENFEAEMPEILASSEENPEIVQPPLIENEIEEKIASNEIEEKFVSDEIEENFVDKEPEAQPHHPIETEIEEDINELEQPIYTEFSDDSEFAGEKSGGSLIGNIISSIGIFLIGAILGGALFYVFSQNSFQPIPNPTPPQTTENELKNEFEESRRSVDKSPADYIRENGSNVASGEEFYLIGRAYFFNGNFLEAKKALEEAQNRLDEIDEDNRKVIENDIAVLLTNIDVPFAEREIKKYLNKQTEDEGKSVEETESNEN